jgi:hypothetical protein
MKHEMIALICLPALNASWLHALIFHHNHNFIASQTCLSCLSTLKKKILKIVSNETMITFSNFN